MGLQLQLSYDHSPWVVIGCQLFYSIAAHRAPSSSHDTSGVSADGSSVSFANRHSPGAAGGFGLAAGDAVVLRHTFEISHPDGTRMLDSIVIRGCVNVSLADITIHSSPGIGVLVHDTTNVRIERVHNVPASDALPLAGNASSGRHCH